MASYIIRVTDQLIGEYGLDEDIDDLDKKKLQEVVKATLLSSQRGTLKDIGGSRLGELISSLEDEMPGHIISLNFKGRAGKGLRALAAECLAPLICERIRPSPNSTVTPYVRKKRSA